jgi:hypothetical protein
MLLALMFAGMNVHSAPPDGTSRAPESARPVPPTTIEFAFGAPAFVPDSQAARAGGAIVIGAEANREARPLVVFLHGLNEAGPLHRELDVVARVAAKLVADGTIVPLLVAAPSQTRNASRPWDMWEAFELGSFLAALEPALDAAGAPRVDRARVVLVGHSGGGCNPKGSILSPRGRSPASAILAIDTCFDPKVAAALRDTPPSTHVWAYWQTTSWDRDTEGFRRAFLAPGDPPADRRAEKAPIEGPGAHDAILPWALRRALPLLLKPEA